MRAIKPGLKRDKRGNRRIDSDRAEPGVCSETAHDAFPDRQNFANLKTDGQLTSSAEAAIRVLAWLDRAYFGTTPVSDVRDA